MLGSIATIGQQRANVPTTLAICSYPVKKAVIIAGVQVYNLMRGEACCRIQVFTLPLKLL